MTTIYSTPTCAYCAQVKKLLTAWGVAYEEKSALDAPEYPELAQKYGMTVPLIVNGDKGMVGFDVARLKQIVS